jgi:predicted membrane protein
VTIDAGTVSGDVDLLMPEGVAVEVRSRTSFGDVRVRLSRLRERLFRRAPTPIDRADRRSH